MHRRALSALVQAVLAPTVDVRVLTTALEDFAIPRREHTFQEHTFATREQGHSSNWAVWRIKSLSSHADPHWAHVDTCAIDKEQP